MFLIHIYIYYNILCLFVYVLVFTLFFKYIFEYEIDEESVAGTILKGYFGKSGVVAGE